jgi:hypothetical protein
VPDTSLVFFWCQLLNLEPEFCCVTEGQFQLQPACVSTLFNRTTSLRRLLLAAEAAYAAAITIDVRACISRECPI